MAFIPKTWVNDQIVYAEDMNRIEQGITETDTLLREKANQNLLINWDFRNPIDQRQGRIVKPNTTYYSDNQLTTSAGTTSAYATAYRYATGTASGVSYASFKLTDSDTAPTYYAAPENVVRGYTGAGYGIDRWKTNTPYTTALIKDDCVEVISTADSSTMGIFSQPTTLNELGVSSGNTVTLSFLSEIVSAPNGNIRLQIDNDTKSDYSQGDFVQAVVGSKTIYSITKTIPTTWEKTDIIRITMFRTGSFDVKEYAAKLELGSQQTLAHQDENGNWVLNEVNFQPPTTKKGTIKLSTNWSGDSSPYTQTVTVPGTTSNSKVDLQPDSTSIAQMADDGTVALYIANNNGVLTANAVGEKPTAEMTIQATITEVI